MAESTKFEMVIAQKLFELQHYGLTCVVVLTCGLINFLIETHSEINKVSHQSQTITLLKICVELLPNGL